MRLRVNILLVLLHRIFESTFSAVQVFYEVRRDYSVRVFRPDDSYCSGRLSAHRELFATDYKGINTGQIERKSYPGSRRNHVPTIESQWNAHFTRPSRRSLSSLDIVLVP